MVKGDSRRDKGTPAHDRYRQRQLLRFPGEGQVPAAHHVQAEGTPVSAPVPGIVDGDRAYFGVSSRSGAVKRLQHTDGVQLAPCRALGLVSYGPPLDAAARRLTGQEASHVAGQLARAYPVRRRSLAGLLQRARRRRLVYYELLGP